MKDFDWYKSIIGQCPYCEQSLTNGHHCSQRDEAFAKVVNNSLEESDRLCAPQINKADLYYLLGEVEQIKGVVIELINAITEFTHSQNPFRSNSLQRRTKKLKDIQVEVKEK